MIVVIPIDFSCDVSPAIEFVLTFIDTPVRIIFIHAYICDIDCGIKEFSGDINDFKLEQILSVVSKDFQEKSAQMETLKLTYAGVGEIETHLLLTRRDQSMEETIRTFILKAKPEMVIIDSRHSRSILGYLFKSVAAYLISHSKVPITVLHERAP
ncbi:hypothetical protein HZS_4192 [Henneguya salminicola]|nr:hypothetical protein HZS_4192 [Henneguya salminicola]